MKSVISIVAVMSALVLVSPVAFGQSSSSTPGGSPSTANPNPVPSGGMPQSTTPPATQLPAASGGGRRIAPSGQTVGQAGRTSQIDEKPDPRVEETEREVSRRIKSICKGC